MRLILNSTGKNCIRQANIKLSLFFQNGEKYEGEFEDNTIVGNGTYYWPEGRKYVGEMVAGNSHGKGVMLYPPEDPDFR